MIYFQHLRKYVGKMPLIFLAAAAASLTFMPVATAVTPDAALVKAATAAGADRTKSLIDGAKKEGQLTFYTSAPVDDVTAVTAAFEKKYGVKVNIWRASSEKVVQRILT